MSRIRQIPVGNRGEEIDWYHKEVGLVVETPDNCLDGVLYIGVLS